MISLAMISKRVRLAYPTLINASIYRHNYYGPVCCRTSPAVTVNKIPLPPHRQFKLYHSSSKSRKPKSYSRSKMTSVIDTEQSDNSLNALQNEHRMKANKADWKCNSVSDGDSYEKCINDLNLLIKLITPLTKRDRLEILPLFTKQLNLAGISLADLDRLNIIHVSGTKGKGSTCAFVESILRGAGLRTGFYSSPHLIKTNERIRLNGESIDDASFSKYFRQVYDRLLVGTKAANVPMPGYFSFLTILAFHVFIDQKVDAAVIEVGVGGEYDPTNVVRKPIACGISTLDYDHTSILGETLAEIAWSKAGIAKRGVPLFTVAQDQSEALEVIKSRALEKKCPLYVCQPLDQSSDLDLGIKGSAQFTNAALACQLARFSLETTFQQSKPASMGLSHEVHADVRTDLSELPNHYRQSISNCRWPGRCQVVRYPRITFFLDGAHTKKSMENCLEWFISTSKDGHEKAADILMVNIIGERDRLPILFPLSRHESYEMILFSTNKVKTDSDHKDGQQDVKMMENVRNNANTWKSLVGERQQNATIHIMPSTSACLHLISQICEENPQKKYNILVTGSLHFVGAVLETLPVFEDLLVKKND